MRAVLIRAEGPSFTVGGDVAAMARTPPAELPALVSRITATYHATLQLLDRLPVPVVTAVHGAVAGGGLGLVYVADIVLAAESARFTAGFAGLGLSVDSGGTWFLPRLVGTRRAAELCFSQRVLTASQAAEWGLITRVVRDEDLAAEAETAARAARGRPDAGPGRDQGPAAPFARRGARRPAPGRERRAGPDRRHPGRGARHRELHGQDPARIRGMLNVTGLITDTSDHRLIRQSTAAIAARYGHGYYAERAREGGHIAELWGELGQAGLLGVHLPAEYGGGGAGLAELTVVTEELAAHGLPLLIAVISPAICGSILAAHASDGHEGQLAAGTGRRHPADGVRADRAGRRVQQPQRQHHRPPDRPGLGRHRRQVLHLGRGRMRGAAAGRPGRQRHRAASRCSWCRPTPPA